MGCIPVKIPPRAPGESDAEYRKLLGEYRAMMNGIQQRYSHSMAPFVMLGCVAIPVAIVAIIALILGMFI